MTFMERTSKIFVAGHRGLVGSSILGNLKAKGYENIITRSHSELDLTDKAATTSFFNKEKPEYVFLAAAKVGGILANNNYRADFIYENLMIQNNVIHQSYLHGVKKLLFLGSTCVYPKRTPQPIKEEYLLTGALEYSNEPYAIAKIAGLRMCESYNIQFGTNFISGMPTNLYGPNDNFNLATSHVLPALMRKMHLGRSLEDGDWDSIRADLDKRPIDGINGKADKREIMVILEKHGVKLEDNNRVVVEVWGSGNPRREFLWNEDMADACIFLMEHKSFRGSFNVFSSCGKCNESRSALDFDQGQVRNTHINIGTGKETSIKKLTKKIKVAVGFKGRLIFDTSRLDGTPLKISDVSKLNQLGWRHKVELDEGIARLYNWYRTSV